METICFNTLHNVRGSGVLAGAELIGSAIILLATVNAKLHLRSAGVRF